MHKILIANRGEIAVRIIRTCRDMGLGAVAVFSDCDRSALHVRLADEAHAIGADPASESYLRIDKLIDVARSSGADAVHPGYGFLAENPQFAEACSAAGLTFIGPDAKAMRVMGSKTSARDLAVAVGVPVLPGGETPAGLGYPLLVKAVAGGGGKGMRVVRSAAELDSAVEVARSEALSSFDDGRVYFEQMLEGPRHIEVQLLGDAHGMVVPFIERECSLQRRRQKLIEETPSPSVTLPLRERLLAAAAAIGRASGYMSAGTVEFLVDAAGEFYFLEMNTRLQVEHPITEAVTGLDFVRAQIEIARGARLEDIAGLAELKVGTTTDADRRVETSTSVPVTPTFRGARANGHAIEVRVYAEDPDQGFLPSPGRITHLRAPSGPGIRDDSGVFEGWTVPTAYDPLLSKVIAWAPDRAGAIARAVRALSEYDVRGIRTTIGFCRDLIRSSDFAAGAFDTNSVDRLLEQDGRHAAKSGDREEIAVIAAAIRQIRHRRSGVADRRAASEGRSTMWAQRARLESLR